MINRFDTGPQTTTVIDGVEYTLNVSYDGCCMVWDGHESMEAGELSEEAYAALMIEMMYHDPKPNVFNKEALEFASAFLNYYNTDAGERRSRMPPISIRQDWPMMVSSFLLLGVDLRTDIIDYGKFQYLLRNLPEGCEYARIISLRIRHYDERRKMSDKERKQLNEDIERVGRNRVIIESRKNTAVDREDAAEYEEVNRKRIAAGLNPI